MSQRPWYLTKIPQLCKYSKSSRHLRDTTPAVQVCFTPVLQYIHVTVHCRLTFTLPLGCSSSVTDTLSCCSRLFTSLEQQTLTAPCTCDALYSEKVLLSITSRRLVPLWMRLARRLMSMALRLVGPFSPAMFFDGGGRAVGLSGGSEVRVAGGGLWGGRLNR